MPRKSPGRVTVPRLERAFAMREIGMSYEAIAKAMEVYEGNAPTGTTLRNYLVAAGCRKSPRGPAEANFKR